METEQLGDKNLSVNTKNSFNRIFLWWKKKEKRLLPFLLAAMALVVLISGSAKELKTVDTLKDSFQTWEVHVLFDPQNANVSLQKVRILSGKTVIQEPAESSYEVTVTDSDNQELLTQKVAINEIQNSESEIPQTTILVPYVENADKLVLKRNLLPIMEIGFQ